MAQETTTTVVFFLGGCTYTEIAALRWVGRQNRGEQPTSFQTSLSFTYQCLGRKFLIATTGIISGASIVDGVSGIGQSVAPSKVGTATV